LEWIKIAAIILILIMVFSAVAGFAVYFFVPAAG